jgi:3-hydroxyacyl-CoA dehydrogenase
MGQSTESPSSSRASNAIPCSSSATYWGSSGTGSSSPSSESVYLVEGSVASLADVDRAVRDGYARRTAVIGPFETADLAGLDLFETIAAELYPHLTGNETPANAFDERLAAGRGGVRDGAGFYEHEERPGAAKAATDRRDEGLAALRRALGIGLTAEDDPIE